MGGTFLRRAINSDSMLSLSLFYNSSELLQIDETICHRI